MTVPAGRLASQGAGRAGLGASRRPFVDVRPCPLPVFELPMSSSILTSSCVTHVPCPCVTHVPCLSVTYVRLHNSPSMRKSTENHFPKRTSAFIHAGAAHFHIQKMGKLQHLPSNRFRQPAQLFADALGLFLVIMHDGILKRCAAEATLRRGDSPTANPKGAQASAGVKSLDRLYRVVSLRHRHSLYSTISTPPMGASIIRRLPNGRRILGQRAGSHYLP